MENVRFIPFSMEELEEIQLTITDKLLEMNKSSSLDDSSKTFQTLCNVVQKCHKYHPSQIKAT